LEFWLKAVNKHALRGFSPHSAGERVVYQHGFQHLAASSAKRVNKSFK
jgi:hypothetical protein